MRINQNIGALNAYRNLVNNENRMEKSLERLSSGLRINRAADDAAGLSISEKMRGQIRGLGQAMSNAQDGISLVQTAEGALNETHSILQRMRELSVQAANDTLTADDRMDIQEEIDQLAEEVDRIANTTEFNTKQLLDGTASGLSSTDDLKTKVFMRDGLRTVDQFGQKGVDDGNYKMEIEADAGVGQVQKTDVMKVKHEQGLELDYLDLGEEADVEALEGWEVAALTDDVVLEFVEDEVDGDADFEVATDVADDGVNTVTITFDEDADSVSVEDIAIAIAEHDGSGDALDAADLIHMKYDEELGLDTDVEGHISELEGLGEIELGDPEYHSDMEELAWEDSAGEFEIAAIQQDLELEIVQADTVGVELGVNTEGVTTVTITGDWADGDDAGDLFEAILDSDAHQLVNIKELDSDGDVEPGTYELEGPGEFRDVGDIANRDTEIQDIDLFWDASGNFLVEDPQSIELVQGDGSKTSVTIFGTDTIQEVEDKLNNAIHEGLGQNEFVDDAFENNYAQFVPDGEATDGDHFSVDGTFVIQSAVTGAGGEISFIGGEDMLNALGLSEIRESSETQFTVSVEDAHTGEMVVDEERISGNRLVGEIHPHVDVEFDPMAGMELNTDDISGDNESFVKFSWNDHDDGVEDFSTNIHLADNTMVFQIGANPLQDVDAAIGDMRAEALGVDNILVTDRDSANRAITQVDQAIDRVSAERSKMGALQNRLEHTINNLGVAEENLTAAESRIRDLDFAREMVDFTRNQIMQQAGTSMMAQANMQPESVLMLLG